MTASCAASPCCSGNAVVVRQTRKHRRHFKAYKDLCLLREVVAANPFENPGMCVTFHAAIHRPLTLRSTKGRLQLLLWYFRLKDSANHRWWPFNAQHVLLLVVCSAATCCALFIAWKVTQMVRLARKRQLLAKHVQDGYVFLGETNVAMEYSCHENDARHYRLLEAAQTL